MADKGKNALMQKRSNYVDNYDRLGGLHPRVAREMDPMVGAIERSEMGRGARETDPRDGEGIDAILEAAMHAGWKPPAGRNMTIEDWRDALDAAQNSSMPGFGGDTDTGNISRARATMGLEGGGRDDVDPYALGGYRPHSMDPRLFRK